MPCSNTIDKDLLLDKDESKNKKVEEYINIMIKQFRSYHKSFIVTSSKPININLETEYDFDSFLDKPNEYVKNKNKD